MSITDIINHLGRDLAQEVLVGFQECDMQSFISTCKIKLLYEGKGEIDKVSKLNLLVDEEWEATRQFEALHRNIFTWFKFHRGYYNSASVEIVWHEIVNDYLGYYNYETENSF